MLTRWWCVMTTVSGVWPSCCAQGRRSLSQRVACSRHMLATGRRPIVSFCCSTASTASSGSYWLRTDSATSSRCGENVIKLKKRRPFWRRFTDRLDVWCTKFRPNSAIRASASAGGSHNTGVPRGTSGPWTMWRFCLNSWTLVVHSSIGPLYVSSIDCTGVAKYHGRRTIYR